MMEDVVLSLDLSTKTGWALFINGKLKEFDTLFIDKKTGDFGKYPFNYVDFSMWVARNILILIKRLQDKYQPIRTIVIEETTGSKNSYSQKVLEFIHFSTIMFLREFGFNDRVYYIRTGIWRKEVGATQTKEERNFNAKIGRIKRKTGKRLAKIDGRVAGKLDRKNYALRAFEEHFGIKLDKKMNDACDAALIGLAYLKGVPHCDGTVFGGTGS